MNNMEKIRNLLSNSEKQLIDEILNSFETMNFNSHVINATSQTDIVHFIQGFAEAMRQFVIAESRFSDESEEFEDCFSNFVTLQFPNDWEKGWNAFVTIWQNDINLNLRKLAD